MLPNVPPKLFSLSAVVVGYILIDDMTANEQNAVGNWLMLVAQVLSTNAFYRAVMKERGLEPSVSTETGRNNAFAFSGMGSINSSGDKEETIQMLEKMLKAIEKELDNIKNSNWLSLKKSYNTFKRKRWKYEKRKVNRKIFAS